MGGDLILNEVLLLILFTLWWLSSFSGSFELWFEGRIFFVLVMWKSWDQSCILKLSLCEIHEAYVSGYFPHTNKRVLMNVAAESNRHLNNTALFSLALARRVPILFTTCRHIARQSKEKTLHWAGEIKREEKIIKFCHLAAWKVGSKGVRKSTWGRKQHQTAAC